MAKATSINIQPIKATSELHNTREKTLDYVKSELSHNNRSWQCDTIANRLETINRNYTATTGQKMQKKATPIREGVVVINEDTTLNHLNDFAKKIEERFGIKTIQMYLHKDEGHIKDDKWKPNLHAHMIFDWTQSNGKSIKLNKQDMAEMQTMLSEALGMKRGKSSDIKHLNSIQYKNKREEERLELLKSEVERIEVWKSVKTATFKTFDKVSNILGKTSKEKHDSALNELKNALQKELDAQEKKYKAEKEELIRDKQKAEHNYNSTRAKLNQLSLERVSIEKKIKEYEKLLPKKATQLHEKKTGLSI